LGWPVRGLLLALALALGWFALATAQTPPREADKVWDYLASVSKDQRLSILEREARREGSVVVYGALGIDRARLFLGPCVFRPS